MKKCGQEMQLIVCRLRNTQIKISYILFGFRRESGFLVYTLMLTERNESIYQWLRTNVNDCINCSTLSSNVLSVLKVKLILTIILYF